MLETKIFLKINWLIISNCNGNTLWWQRNHWKVLSKLGHFITFLPWACENSNLPTTILQKCDGNLGGYVTYVCISFNYDVYIVSECLFLWITWHYKDTPICILVIEVVIYQKDKETLCKSVHTKDHYLQGNLPCVTD